MPGIYCKFYSQFVTVCQNKINFKLNFLLSECNVYINIEHKGDFDDRLHMCFMVSRNKARQHCLCLMHCGYIFPEHNLRTQQVRHEERTSGTHDGNHGNSQLPFSNGVLRTRLKCPMFISQAHKYFITNRPSASRSI